jgi:hypothetical protein
MAWATLIMIGALLAQFLLGMATNLFVTIPAHHPGARPGNYFVGSGQSVGWAITSGPLALAAHAILGILLVVAGFVLISLAASSGRRGVLIASILGALFILGAGFNGASFLNFNDNPSSMIMAGLFAAALACYVVVLFQLNRAPASAGTGGPRD